MILTSRQPHRVTQDELKMVGLKKQQQQSGNETGSALGQGAYSHKNMWALGKVVSNRVVWKEGWSLPLISTMGAFSAVDTTLLCSQPQAPDTIRY